MSIRCEGVSHHILPLYRAFVAKELVERYSFTHVRAVEKLGTMQATISQYLSFKRGRKGISYYNEFAPLVKEEAIKVAKSLTKPEMSTEEFTESFCDLCRSLRKAKKIC